jgi:hypothetical protein
MSAALVMARAIAVLAVGGVAVSAWRAASASSDAHLARVQAAAFSQQLAEIERLRPQRQTALLASKPTESVSAALRASLATAGVGEASLRSVNPGSDEALAPNDPASPAYRRQTIAVALGPITVRQLGQFLAAWRTAEPAWIVTRLDCTHAGGKADPNSTYDARLTLATTYLVSPVTNPSPQ